MGDVSISLKLKTIILCLIICFFLTMGSACAATLNETNDHTTLNTPVVDDSIASARDDSIGVISNNDDSNKLSLGNSNNNVLNDDESSNSTIRDLEKLIKYTPDLLIIENDFTYNSLIDGSNGLEIVKSNYVIDFNGHTLNANGYSGTFLKISGNNVVIKNLKYINGKGTNDDYSIKWMGNNGVLDNVEFKDSPYTVYWDGSDGTLNNAKFTKISNAKLLYTSNNVSNFKFTNSEVSEISCKNSDITVFRIISTYMSNVTFYKITQTTGGTDWLTPFIDTKENVFITNCKFIDSYYSVLLSIGTNCVLSNTVFENCIARNWRGVVASYSSTLGSSIDNCTFKNCKGTGGSSTDLFSKILWLNNPLSTVSNCVFDNNVATAILTLSGAQAVNTVFKNNKGRCIQTFRSDGTYIKNCNFTNNTYSTGTGIYGAKNFVADNCLFKDNTATSNGGGIYITTSLTVVSNSVFINNTARLGKGIYVTNGLNVKINESNVWNKSYEDDVYGVNIYDETYNYLYVSQNGAGNGLTPTNPTTLANAVSKLALYGTIEFINNGQPYAISQTISTPMTLIGNGVTVTNNRQIFNLNEVNHVNINGFKFIRCGSTSYTAPIFVSGYIINISNCIFDNCVGTSAGAIRSNFESGFLRSAMLTIENCNFTNNHASASGGSGALMIYSAGLTVNNCNFDNNYGNYAGAIRLIAHNEGDSGTVGTYEQLTRDIINCNFTNNRVTITNTYGGGAIHTSAYKTNIIGCRFENNRAEGLAGAVFFNKYNCGVYNSTFISNTAVFRGGAIYSKCHDITVSGCNFTKNKANDYGGAILYLSNNDFAMDNCIFNSNTATYGSTFSLHPSITGTHKLTLINISMFNHNNPLWFNKYSVDVNGGSFNNNTGGVFVGSYDGATLYVNNAFFKNNTGCDNGSAINFIGYSEIHNSEFVDNSALISGGAVYLTYEGCIIQASVFTNNTAGIAGALYVGGANFIVRDSNFTKNNATRDGQPYGGGAIFDNGEGLLIFDSLFQYNTAFYGGAIYVNNNLGYFVNQKTRDTFHDYNKARAPDNVLPDWPALIGSYTAEDIAKNVSSEKLGLTYDYNHIYERFALELLYEAYVVLDPEHFYPAGSGIVNNQTGTRTNPMDFTSAFGKVAPGGSIIFINASEVHDFTGHEPYKLNKMGIKFIGNNTTFVGLRFIINDLSVDVEYHNFIFTGCSESVFVWNATGGLVENCTFIKNMGSQDCLWGLALSILKDNFTLSKTKFINNTFNTTKVDDIIGGVVFVNASNVDINDCEFRANSGKVSHLYLAENTESIYVTNSVFNSADPGKMGVNGVAIHIGSLTDVIISDCNFTDNIAVQGNGAIEIDTTIFKLSIINNLFNGNRVGYGNGGAIGLNLNKGSQFIVINNNNFINNHADYNGGALYITGDGNSLILEGNNFTNNSAGRNGGAVYLGVPITLAESNFKDNVADMGGALYINTTGARIVDSNFTYNNASYGSAIFYGEKSRAELFNLLVKENHVTGEWDGRRGDICLGPDSTAGIPNDDVKFDYFTGSPMYMNYIGNYSTYHLTVVYVNSTGTGLGTSSLDATTIEKALDLVVKVNGTIVFCENMDVSVVLSNFTNLVVRSNVGESYTIKRKVGKNVFVLTNGSTVTIKNLGLGGGVEVGSNNKLDLNNVTVTITDSESGGIVYNTSSSGNIVNSNFTGSKNIDHALTVNGNVNVEYCEFSNNNLTGSAVYYTSAGTGSISNSTFYNNTASGDVRNINIPGLNKVSVNDNNIDVVLKNITISNDVYGYDLTISGYFDAGVNFEIPGIALVVNDTLDTTRSVNVAATTGKFTTSVINGGILAVGLYNVTSDGVQNSNKYNVVHKNNTFIINKANVSADSAGAVITVSYGMKDTIIITGTFNSTQRIKYNGNVTLTISNDLYSIKNITVVVKDGAFSAVLYDRGTLGAGNYNVTVSPNAYSNNQNFTVGEKVFINHVVVNKAVVGANATNNVTVVYAMNKTITITGTFNASTYITVNASKYNGFVIVSITGPNGAINNTAQVIDGVFSVVLNDDGRLGAGLYNIVVSNNQNSLNANYTVANVTLVNKVNVTKAVVGANYTSDVSVVYGMNNTIVIEGTFNASNGDYAINYNGNVTITINNDSYSITNSSVIVRDGKFRAVIVDGGKLGVGIYNITVLSNAQSLNANYTVKNVEFSNKVSVSKAVVGANYTSNVVVVYGMNNTIVIEGTFNASNGDYAVNYNGNVTVTIGNGVYSITNSSVIVSDGKFKAILTDQARLGVGIYNITVSSNAQSLNENYTIIDKTFVNNVNVTKANVNCYVNNITVVYGVNNTITISGSVSNSTYGVKYNGLINITVLNSVLSALNIIVNDGEFSVDLTDRGNLSAGKYDISIKSDYINDNYTFINNTFVNNITVNKADVTAYDLNNITVVYGVNNTINITGKVSNSTYGVKYNGLINITVSNAKSSIVALNVEVIDGEFSINMVDKGNLTSGLYDVTISSNYVNNYTFTTKTFTNNVSVVKYVVSVNIEKVNITYGPNSVNIVGNVSNSTYGLLYDGMISVVVGNHTFNNVEVKNGKFTVEINNLLNNYNASVNNITVLENDLNDNYIINNVTFSDYFIINIASSSINVSSIEVGYSGVINIPVSCVNVTEVIAILYNSDGSVVSSINMTVHGITSIEISGLSAGKYILNVTGVGDINHMNCTGSANITINPTPSSIVVENITVVYSLNSFNVWYTVVNATVDTFVVYDESGNVVSCNIVKHDYSFEISGLAAGKYTFNVTADGGINHEDSSSLSNITVVPAGSKTVVPVVVITYGEHAILNITGENITGIDNIVILNSTNHIVGNYSVNNFTVDVWNLNSSSVSYRVNVTAKVDANHTASYGIGLVFVKKAGSAIIIPDNFNMTYNTFKTINITLVNVTEADIIELYVVSNGEIVDCDLSRDGCNITIGGLDVGDYAVIVVSNGTTNYNASVGAGNFKVIKASSSITVPVLTNMSHLGGVIVINQTVNATGISVNVFDEAGNPIRVTVDGFNIIFDRIAVGNYTMNVTTIVDGNHAPSSAVGKICVMKILAPSSIEILNITNGKFNTSDAVIDFNITNRTVVSIIITNESGDIVYENNDFKLSRFTIGNLTIGIYNITIINQESDYYLASNASAIFKVVVPSSIIASDINRGYNSPYDYVAVFTDEFGNPLVNSTVIMTVDGKSYNVTTNENGEAYLTQSTLPVGLHEITLYNPVTGESEIRNVNIVERLQENRDIVMDFADGTYYSVRAYGDDAKPIAGVYVTIKVNGVTYDVKTNDEGYALLKIRLNPNVYKISAEWMDYKINKIVVKQTLSAKSKVVKKSKNLKYTATLKWSNGNPIVGKVITFKFKGKIYKATTNSKGIAKIKIKKSVLKKLKAGKKYKINITYNAVDGGYTSINSIYKKIKVKN